MSAYPLILATLREFDLISEEQAAAKMDEWNQMSDDYDRRKDEFRERWQAERAALPWRKRVRISDSDWLLDWFKEDQT